MARRVPAARSVCTLSVVIGGLLSGGTKDREQTGHVLRFTLLRCQFRAGEGSRIGASQRRGRGDVNVADCRSRLSRRRVEKVERCLAGLGRVIWLAAGIVGTAQIGAIPHVLTALPGWNKITFGQWPAGRRVVALAAAISDQFGRLALGEPAVLVHPVGIAIPALSYRGVPHRLRLTCHQVSRWTLDPLHQPMKLVAKTQNLNLPGYFLFCNDAQAGGTRMKPTCQPLPSRRPQGARNL